MNTQNNVKSGTPVLPKTIFVIRHGEKPDWYTNPPPAEYTPPTCQYGEMVDGTPNAKTNLTPYGWTRVAQNVNPTFGSASSELATQIFVPSDSTHCQDTVSQLTPSANKNYLSQDYADMVTDLFTGGVINAQDVVLICWQHQYIADTSKGDCVLAEICKQSNTPLSSLPSDTNEAWPGQCYCTIFTFSDPIPGSGYQTVTQTVYSPTLFQWDLPSWGDYPQPCNPPSKQN